MTLFKPAASIYIWQRFYSAEYHLLCGVALTLWSIAYSAEYHLLCGVSLTLRSITNSAEQRLLCGVSLTLQSNAYSVEYRYAYLTEYLLLCVSQDRRFTSWTESAGFNLFSTVCDSLKEIYNSPDDKDINSLCIPLRYVLRSALFRRVFSLRVCI
jgi:hypothetical protein